MKTKQERKNMIVLKLRQLIVWLVSGVAVCLLWRLMREEGLLSLDE